MTMPLWQRAALEAFGTAFLAFTVGRLSGSDFNGLEQAVGIGLCLALLIHLMGRATGAHFNPAVTVALNAQRFGRSRLFSIDACREIFSYIAAQVLGATVGLALNPVDGPANAFGVQGLVPEFVFSLVLYALILRWSTEGRICPVAQPLSGLGDWRWTGTAGLAGRSDAIRYLQPCDGHRPGRPGDGWFSHRHC